MEVKQPQGRRLLFITPGIYFDPTQTAVREKYRWLSRDFSGAIFAVVHDRAFRTVTLDHFKVFAIYLPPLVRNRSYLRSLLYVSFVLFKGLRLFMFSGFLI